LRRINVLSDRSFQRWRECGGAHPAANEGVLEMIRTIMLALVLLLSGCSLLDGVPEKAVVDTLCLTAERKPWSVNDTSETIRDAKAWNRKIDRHCGVAGKVASR
jgi:hypothetical protein